jgi:hypothetical protein
MQASPQSWFWTLDYEYELADQHEQQQQLLFELNAEAFPVIQSHIIAPRSFELGDSDVPF